MAEPDDLSDLEDDRERDEDVPAGESPFTHHVAKRTVVLPDLRVLFLPVPKAGCTTLLWLLADMAGIPREVFEQSASLEASASLIVHDTNRWPDENRLFLRTPQERAALLAQDGWLRFSLVRDPATRLWSAWQSKLLMREPRFVELFGEEPWFPRVPRQPQDIVEDFRTFVASVGAHGALDVHWTPQSGLVDQVPLTHLGRLERMDDTLAVLREHVGEEHWPDTPGEENRSPLRMPPHAYDAPAAEVLRSVYADDYEAFGYEPPAVTADGEAMARWEAGVEPALPALRGAIEDRARVGQLHRVAQRRKQRLDNTRERLERTRERLKSSEQRVQEVSRRTVGGTRSPVITNLEEEEDFTVRWAWADGPLELGFTAVVRAKNEARTLPFTLPPLFRAVSRVVLIDNDSDDGTPDVARNVARECGAEDRFEVLEYPFSIARCGAEHLGTPPDSVHSLVHFYNWSFSQVRTRYALKWDADMVLSDAAVRTLRDLEWQLEAAEVVVMVPRNPLYLADDRRGYVDVGLHNCEPWGWPNRPGYSFVKAMDWELPMWGAKPRRLTLPAWSCVELKFLDADEFGHWTDTDFETSDRQKRKRREWEVFQALVAGRRAPGDVVAVEAPEGVHVVDHVRTTWLREQALGRRALAA